MLLVVFVAFERRSDHPMLDVALFRNPRFTAASGSVAISFFALQGFIFLVTQYFQFIKNFSPLGTGVRLLPVASSVAVASIVGTKLAVRLGNKVDRRHRSHVLRRRAPLELHRVDQYVIYGHHLARCCSSGPAWVSPVRRRPKRSWVLSPKQKLGSDPRSTTPPAFSGARSESPSSEASQPPFTRAGWPRRIPAHLPPRAHRCGQGIGRRSARSLARAGQGRARPRSRRPHSCSRRRLLAQPGRWLRGCGRGHDRRCAHGRAAAAGSTTPDSRL